MSTALLKFQPAPPTPKEAPLDPSILAGAVDVSPQPIAVCENGKVIYGNRSFAQLSVPSEADKPHVEPSAIRSDSNWRSTSFSVAGRSFSLATLHRDPLRHSVTDSAHFEMVGRLVGGVAHDFNNLLTGILLYCDLLKTKLDSANPLALQIEEIRYAAEQGAGLIRQLMTVGREEKGAPRWVSINHALREIVPLLRHLAGENIAITLELATGAPRVGLSLAEAQQLILNLVLNARDAMPAGGTVALETRLGEFEGTGRGRKILEFTVSDSGTGMDQQTAAHIFEPFYTTKILGRGTGMGLMTVRRVVEDAGGIICVDTAPGKGTRMTVRLPQIELRETGGEGPRAHLHQSEARQPKTRQPNNRGEGL
jgi:signal transduction histidine kinase